MSNKTCIDRNQAQIGVRTCERCATRFEYEKWIIGDREVFTNLHRFCEPCGKIHNAEREEQIRIEQAEERDRARTRRLNEWEASICPPLYRDAKPDKLPENSRRLLQDLMLWEYNPRGSIISGECILVSTKFIDRALKGLTHCL